MLDKIKAFFAKDVVKIIAGGVWIIISGLIVKFVPADLQLMVMGMWTSIGVALGIASGGTSNLRSNESKAQIVTLQDKGVLPK